MASNQLEKLLEQQTELAKKIEEARKSERQPIINEIKNLIKLHGITAKELGFKPKPPKTTTATTEKTPIPALYQNEDGATWSGRGRVPLWLKDKNNKVSERLKNKYLINQEPEQ